ncbi:MAG TPA: hypothetical protein VF841_15690 [Anaeromyxobacter sp.]
MRPSHLALLLLAVACTAGPPTSGQAGPASDVPAAGAPSGAPASSPASPASPGAAAISIERLDPDPGCDDVVPERAPAPVLVTLDVPAGAACVGGVSDGTGAVALGVRDAAGAVSWRVHGADGSPAGVFDADAPILSQPAGWHGLQVSRPPFGADPTVDHVAVSPSGDLVRRERVSPDPTVAVGPRWSLAPDPAGGSAVAMRATFVAGNHWSEVTVQRFDAAGAPRWPADTRALTVDSARDPSYLGAGIATGGDLLVLAQHSAFLDVAWLDGDASAAGGSVLQEGADAVVGAGTSHALELAPLLDGTVAVRSDGTWRRRYAPGAGASEPLPDWLASRAGDGIRLAAGGRGYALLPPAGVAAPDCTTRIELVSRDGRTCGRVTVREAGSACTVRNVDVGRDGTLVVPSAADACAVRWWPRLLAG